MTSIEAQLRQYGGYLEELFDSGAPAPEVGRDRPRGKRSRGLLAVAAALLIAALAATLTRSDSGTTVTAGEGPTIALVPERLPEGMHLEGSHRQAFAVGPDVEATAVFGPADGGPADPMVVVEAFNSDAPASPDSNAAVQGRPAVLHRGGGVITLQWSDGRRQIHLSGSDSLGTATVRELAEGTSVEGAHASIASLPNGWGRRWETSGLDFPTTSYVLTNGSERVQVTTWSNAPTGAELGIHVQPGATRTTVRGQPAYLDVADDHNPFLWWVERPGLVVLVQHSGGDVGSVRGFADALRPVDADGWRTFAGGRAPATATHQPTTTLSAAAMAEQQATLALFRLTAFARQPRPEELAAVGFADGPISLLLNDRVVATKRAGELADPAAWVLPGGESVLDRIAPVRDGMTTALGPLISCDASPNTPSGITFDQWRVADPLSVDSCADWFGVGVFLRDGRIVAVSLVLPRS